MTKKTPAEPGADETFEVFGDITDYWTYTQLRDWVLLLPDLSRTALHLYLVLRSMVSESARRAGGGLRRMSIDQLCYLLPGVNGKPASATMVKDALRMLDAAGLVMNPDGERLVTSTGKGGIQTALRRYRVVDLPPDTYTGWRNVWDKLDSYTPDWRESPPQPPTHTRTPDGIVRARSGGEGEGAARPHTVDAPAADQPPAPAPGAAAAQPRPNKRLTADPKPAAAADVPAPRGRQDDVSAGAETVAMLTSLPGKMHQSDALELAPLVADAEIAGWTLAHLRAHLSRKCDPARVYDVAAVYRKHLKRLPAAPGGAGAPPGAAPPPCGLCNGSGLEEDPLTFLPTGRQCACRRAPVPAS